MSKIRASHFLPGRIIASIKENVRVKPLSDTYSDISDWFKTPIGQYHLQTEQRLMQENLSNLFGYHLMQLSVCEDVDFAKDSRINHCFTLAPALRSDSEIPHAPQGVARFDALPFEDEEIDVTILHHVLEFSDNPHQVLKEAARVTMPRGYIIVIGFNPMSLSGGLHGFGRVFSRRPIWKRHSFLARRIRDWLAFLDFSCVDTRYVSFNLPINNQRYLERSAFIDRMIGGKAFPFGSSYCMLARKDKAGLTPIKPKWEKTSLIEALPLPKQAIKVPAVSDKKASVLPFRNKIRKGI